MPLIMAIVPEGFQQAEKLLAGIKNGFPKAAAEAINRGLTAGRKVAVQGIRTRYNIKSSSLKGEGMKIKRATWGSVSGSLSAKGTMLPVRLFSPRVKWKRINKRRRQFLTAMIIKGSRKLVRGAFMTKTGKVMERRQEARYPIFPVSTIGVPFMISNRRVSKKVQDTITDATKKRLAHNVAFMTAKAAGRISSKPKL